MIAIDTNILIYSHRVDSEWHVEAAEAIRRVAEGRTSWAIPWPCIHEYLAIVTHPRIYDPPSTAEQALAQVDAWFESPSIELLNESADYWPTLKSQIQTGRVTGPRMHDARIAAVCLNHGVTEFWTADRDFNRFPGLSCQNPLF